MTSVVLTAQCESCHEVIAMGPFRPPTLTFFNALAAEHVCAGTEAPRSGVMTAEEIQALIDADKAKL